MKTIKKDISQISPRIKYTQFSEEENGIKNGKCVLFLNNTKVKNEYFLKGKLHGETIAYNTDGSIYMIKNFKSGRQKGLYKIEDFNVCSFLF